MIETTTEYVGELRCKNTHGPSGNVCETDAPVDNQGRGESFSPTDLVGTALGSCMATTMAIVAARKDINLIGMQVTVGKHMSTDPPRRIAKLDVRIDMPLPEDHPERRLLENAALSCPVHKSLGSEVQIPIEWHWLPVAG